MGYFLLMPLSSSFRLIPLSSFVPLGLAVSDTNGKVAGEAQDSVTAASGLAQDSEA